MSHGYGPETLSLASIEIDRNLIKKFRRRRKRRDAEKNSDRPSDFNLPNIPHQTPVHNDEPLVSP